MSVQLEPSLKPGGYREFLTLAYPLIISNASMAVMNFVDRLFLSWLSPEAIAASLPAGILFFTLIALFFGISEYTNTFVSQFYGAGRPKSIGRATWQGMYISLAGGAACVGLAYIGTEIIKLGGHEPHIVQLELTYFNWLMVGGPFFIINHALSSFYSGRGKTKVVMLVNLFANILNGILDYGLIFGCWGFPQLGIAGAGIATAAAQALATAIYLFLFLSPKNHNVFHTRSVQIDWNLIGKFIRYGSPVGVQIMLEIGSFSAFIFIIGRLGNAELAASNIILSINMLAFFPMLGAGVAITALVGRYIGKNDLITAEKSVYTALISVEIYMLFFALIYFFFPHLLLMLFKGDYQSTDVPFSLISEYGIRVLKLVALYQIADAMIITFSGALRGAGDTSFPMWTCIILAWTFFVPGTWFMSTYLEWGVFGAWLWATFYITLLGVIFLFRFRSGKWKTFKLIDHEDE